MRSNIDDYQPPKYSGEIQVPISPGELLDKITILEIKSERIVDPTKLANVNTELTLLMTVWRKSVRVDAAISDLGRELKSVNKQLWQIEDDIRNEEHNKRYSERFKALARSVYVVNDKRADIKKRVNIHLNSTIMEEKSYTKYNND